jgi:molecular chaperone DnaJ
MKFHPDQNAGDKDAEEKFKAINEAYEVLGDEEKRARYDRFGKAGVGGAAGGGNPFAGGFPGGGFPGGGFPGGAGFSGDLGDLLGELFGGGAGRRGGGGRGQRGADLKYVLELTFEEAAKGVERTIQVPKIEPCGTCSGSGVKPGAGPQTCGACRGAGQIRFQQGFFSMSRTCPQCGGSGSVITDPCVECKGSGHRSTPDELPVTVPAGVSDGQRLRWGGRGEPGRGGGSAGDLYVEIKLKAHEVFTRKDNDVHCELKVSFAQAALGAEVPVPTLEGPVQMKIPPGTPSEKVFRLKDKGFPELGSSRRVGDQYVTVKVQVPTALTQRQEELLREFAKESGEEVSEHHGFFDKVKSFFS